MIMQNRSADMERQRYEYKAAKVQACIREQYAKRIDKDVMKGFFDAAGKPY